MKNVNVNCELYNIYTLFSIFNFLILIKTRGMLCFKRKVYRYFEEEYEKLSKRKGNTEKVKISYTKISGP